MNQLTFFEGGTGKRNKVSFNPVRIPHRKRCPILEDVKYLLESLVNTKEKRRKIRRLHRIAGKLPDELTAEETRELDEMIAIGIKEVQANWNAKRWKEQRRAVTKRTSLITQVMDDSIFSGNISFDDE